MKTLALLVFLVPIMPVSCAPPEKDAARAPATPASPADRATPTVAPSRDPNAPVALSMRNPGAGWTHADTPLLRYDHRDGMTLTAEHYPKTTSTPAVAAAATVQGLWLNFDPGHRKPTVEVSAEGAFAMFAMDLPEKSGKLHLIVVAFRRIEGLPGLVRISGTASVEGQHDALVAAVFAGAATVRVE